MCVLPHLTKSVFLFLSTFYSRNLRIAPFLILNKEKTYIGKLSCLKSLILLLIYLDFEVTITSDFGTSLYLFEQEATQCIEELSAQGPLHVFVKVGVEFTLERSQITRDHMGHLLYQLVQSEKLSKQDFFKGLVSSILTPQLLGDVCHPGLCVTVLF